MTPTRDPRVRLFAGAVLISFSPVFVALVDLSPTVSAFYRVLIGGAALAVVWAMQRSRTHAGGTAAAMLAGAAVFFALDLWFWHRSIIYIGPGRSTLLANLQVFFMIAAGAWLFAQRPTRRQLVAAAFAVVGLAVMIGPRWLAPTAGYRLGVVLGLLTAASYAGYLLCLRAARARSRSALPAREVAIVSFAAAALLGATAVAEGQGLAVASARDMFWLACYGLLSHACGVLLIASSLNRVTPAETGIALLLQPVLSFVWEVVLFGMEPSLFEIAGAAVTLAAIYAGAVRGREPRRQAVG